MKEDVDTWDFCDACILNSPRRCSDHRVATYEVQAGQGHRIIARGLPKGDAEELRRRFDERSAKYGLTLPPTRVVQDGWAD